MTLEQWEAIKQHNAAYDGQFCYGTKGAKTFCRPSCTVKKGTPQTILIFPDADAAMQAGYKPCHRCRPELPEWHGARQELTERAKEYLQGHYTEKFSLEGMAKALYVDKIYLSQCFKKTTGQTLLRYHNRLRCEEACRLMQETPLSIEVIGNRVGFITSSHFARIFKSFYQVPPTEYRRQYFARFE